MWFQIKTGNGRTWNSKDNYDVMRQKGENTVTFAIGIDVSQETKIEFFHKNIAMSNEMMFYFW